MTTTPLDLNLQQALQELTVRVDALEKSAGNDRLSIGVGVDWQRMKADLTSYSPLAGEVSMSGDDTGWGWNAGALFKVDDTTRIGLTYRSRIDYRLSGTITLGATMPATADLTTPDSASLALFKRLSSRWDLLADMTWTGWSCFHKLEVDSSSGTPVVLIPENWKDTMQYSLGLDYQASDRLVWRFALSYDETTVPDAQQRTPRIPDQNRTMVAVGARYRMSPGTNVDVGYAHLFMRDAGIRHTEAAVALVGTYSDSADVLGVQLNHRF